MATDKTRRKFTPAQRQRALALAEEIGVPAAAKKLRVKPQLIYGWRRRSAPAKAPTKPRKRRTRDTGGTPTPTQTDQATRIAALEAAVLQLTLENQRLRSGN